MFFQAEKGSTISVIGMFVWLINILQGLVLFFFAQSRIFSADIAACNKIILNGGEDSAFKWQ